MPVSNDSRLLKRIGQSGVIQDIRIKSGCNISIRGHGTWNYTKNDGPPHAKIVGVAQDIVKAKHMIHAALAGNYESAFEGRIATNANNSRLCKIEGGDHSKSECATIPLRTEHITRIVGTKGSIVKDLENTSGCSIVIEGKASFPRAKIFGSNSFDVKVAIEMIQSRIREIKRDDDEGEFAESTSMHGDSSLKSKSLKRRRTRGKRRGRGRTYPAAADPTHL